jgi:hypothetical protein
MGAMRLASSLVAKREEMAGKKIVADWREVDCVNWLCVWWHDSEIRTRTYVSDLAPLEVLFSLTVFGL